MYSGGSTGRARGWLRSIAGKERGKPMIELIGTIATVLAVVGVILNNRHKIECFGFWIASNLQSALIHLHTGTWSLMARDLIFLVLAIEGIHLWRSKRSCSKAQAIKGFKYTIVDKKGDRILSQWN
jgi:nicotinamide riboside transporter PnuC